MIELLQVWGENSTEEHHRKITTSLTQVMLWFSTTIQDREKYPNISIEGFMIARDDKRKETTALVMFGDRVDIDAAFNLIQQPPGEFKGRYTARIVSRCDKEPDPVQEVRKIGVKRSGDSSMPMDDEGEKKEGAS